MHPYVHSSAICNSKDIVDEWIQKIVGGGDCVCVCDCVCICTQEYYSAIKYNNPICSYVDGPRHYHTKWNKLERQIPYDITYM